MFGTKSNFKKYTFTFIAGVAAGAVIGLLYAPVTGKKLQKKVLDVTDELQQTVRKIATA
jgi:gas vesicle protein